MLTRGRVEARRRRIPIAAILGIAAVVLFAGWCCTAATARAQQIYRWVDANGKVHFGNQPPPGAKGVEAKEPEKSEMALACEATARQECQKYLKKYGKWQRSEAYRDCLERAQENCDEFQVKAKPTMGRERVVSTPSLPFDPGLGDLLRCEMNCRTRCRGDVEIRTDRVIKKGENYGSEHYSMEVKPLQSGTAYCAVSTRNDNVQLVLIVKRNGDIKASVEGQ